ncbi:DNA-packaging protein, partial [Pseudomonas aeruginosa]
QYQITTNAIEKNSSKICSALYTVCKTVSRRHPDADPLVLESFEREIALARNLSAEYSDHFPGIVDENLATLDQ